MIKAVPVRDKKEQEILCGLCGVAYGADMLAYSVYEDEKPVGLCQFSFKGKEGYIYDLENVRGNSDREALFLLGRSVMNFMDLCNFKDVYFANVTGEKEAFVKALGFRKRDDGKYHIDLTGFFTSSCKEKERNI